MATTAITEADRRAFTAILGADRVRDQATERLVYARDGSISDGSCGLVLLCETTQEVSDCMRVASQRGVPVVPRGSGTGLAGGAVPLDGAVVLSVARMRRIMDVDLDTPCVWVEPGVLNLDISTAVAHLGLHYAPDPSSQAACSIGGNVATADGTKRLIDAGVDSVKVGVGPGSICITRQVAGSGVPQLTAVIECAKAAASSKTPIIADGGIRHPGDVAKAIAAGAQTVMIGSMLAGTDESPGMIMTRRGHRYKASRGMASLAANIDRNKREGNDLTREEVEDYVAEGVEAAVPYRGKAREVLTQLIGGLQSGMSYSGAKNIEEFQEKAIFTRMTGSGLKESGPHDVEVLG